MRKKLTLIFLPLLLILTFMTQYSSSYAQPYTESFNDISQLPATGWYTQNNSSPVGVTNWFQGTPPAQGPFAAYAGAANAYIGANFNNTGTVGTISNWLVTPNRTLRNGDVFSFYTRKPDGQDYPDRLEVRLSTNGASTNVGTGATAVGDFTTLLLSVNPTLVAGVYPKTWTQYTITISGLPAPVSGRIAFRYFITSAGAAGNNSDYIGIDEVNYVPYVCPVLLVTTPSLPNGTAGTPYSQSFSQIGALGAPNFAVVAGALPPGLTLSGAGQLSGTPNASGTYNFTVAVSDASGCSGVKPYSIVVNCPSNPISFSTPPPICSNSSPIALAIASPAGGTYSGPGVSGGMFTPSGGTQEITYTYTDPYGCTHSKNTVINVLAGPSMPLALPVTQTICSGNDIVPIVLTATDPGTTLNWTRDNVATVTGIAASGTGDITGSLANTSSVPVIVTFIITPVAGDCSGTPVIATVTVNPTPAVWAVMPPAAATYVGGQKLGFVVQYSDAVTVNTTGGVPSIPVTLNTGGTVQAQYVHGSGSPLLTFEYTVAATDQDPDGVEVGSQVNLNGGEISSIGGCSTATALNNILPATAVIIHNPVPQVITFNPLTEVTYGDPGFDLSATSSSGLNISFTSSNHAVATVVNGKLHIAGAGTATITASQAGDGNYLPADQVPQTLVVNRKNITVTADAKSKVYSEADPALTYTYSPSLVGSDAFTGALSRTAGENAGNYAIVQNNLTLNNNYQVNYTGANLVIQKAPLTVKAGDKTICLNVAAGTIPVTYSGFRNNEDAAVISNQPVVQVPTYNSAGNYTITPSGGSATNYSFSYASGQLTILPIPEGDITQAQSGAGVVNGFQLTAPAGVGYAWSTGATTNAITVKSSGNYSVVVTNEQGCSKRFDQQISLQTISIPNTFSPNGDGINDYWLIPELSNYPQAYVTVINRDGQVVFESRNFTRWDGRYRGNILPAGVYFYRVRKAPGTEPVTGWLNLLR